MSLSRWALWKVFERETASGPGVVSFISASSYLDGDAFSGMREHMRRVCDDIWILDLGGEGTREEKLAALNSIANFSSVTWDDCPDDWQAPFRPAGTGDYFT